MAEPLALSLPVSEGAEVRIEWTAERIRALNDAPTASPWTLAEPIEWDATDAVRVVSAGFEDDSLLVLAAVRAAGSEGHGDERIGAVLRRRGEEETTLERALLSAEYGSDAKPTRIGIELHPSDDDVPLRAAGDARDEAPTTDEGIQRSATPLDMRLDGVAGTGLFEILRAP